MSIKYVQEDFKGYGFSNSTIKTWIKIVCFFDSICYALVEYDFVLIVIGFITNLFHIFILLQKSMRSSSVNVLMIGIAACDLIILGFFVFLNAMELLESISECWNRYSYPIQAIVLWGETIRDDLARLITWLGISMAVLRLLIVKNSLNPKFEKISNPMFSVIIIFATLVFSTIWSLFYLKSSSLVEGGLWRPPPNCTGFPVNYTEPEFYFLTDEEAKTGFEYTFEIFLIGDGLLKIIPTIMFPVLTGFLITDLKAANTRRKRLMATQSKDKSTDHTTKLVILMTVMFMTAEGPQGIFFILQGLVKHSVGFLQLVSDLKFIFLTFAVINSITHCLICLTVSSPYLKTVQSLFRCGTSKPNKKETGTVSLKVNASMMTPVT